MSRLVKYTVGHKNEAILFFTNSNSCWLNTNSTTVYNNTVVSNFQYNFEFKLILYVPVTTIIFCNADLMCRDALLRWQNANLRWRNAL